MGQTYLSRDARENKDRANPFVESFPSTLFRNPACSVTWPAVDMNRRDCSKLESVREEDLWKDED